MQGAQVSSLQKNVSTKNLQLVASYEDCIQEAHLLALCMLLNTAARRVRSVGSIVCLHVRSPCRIPCSVLQSTVPFRMC